MLDPAIEDLIEELGRLPGIGPKSAQRIAFFVLQNTAFDPEPLAGSLASIRQKIFLCDVCGMFASSETCAVCQDPRRDDSVICVVEEPKDVWAIERTRQFRGLYHVLGGALSPIDGIGPDQLRIAGLLSRIQSGQISEVIIATDPNLEGEATASYLARALAKFGVTISRLASGLPVGGDLEFADEVTLGIAFSNRRPA